MLQLFAPIMALQASSLSWTSTGLLLSSLHKYNSQYSNPTQLCQQQQNYDTIVNCHDVNQLRTLQQRLYTCNTQASIVLVIITAIEHKILNDHQTGSQHSPMLPAMHTTANLSQQQHKS